MIRNFLCLLMIFALSALGRVSVEDRGDHVLYQFNVEKFKFSKTKINGQEFSKLHLVGVEEYEGVNYAVGAPEVPVIRLYVTGKPVITVGEQQIVTQSNKNPKLAPNQPSRVKLPDQKASKISINNTAYASKILLPAQNYKIENAGSIRGQNQYLLTLYPVAYAAKNNQYKFIDKFEVKVPHAKNEVSTGLQTFAFVVPNLFKDSPSIQEYVQHKTRLGFNVVTIPVTSADSPEVIRAKIKDLYRQTNLRYVLIFGDVEFVQSKNSDIITGVTDHYYRAIDTDNYNEDINGPDVGVGRISVKNEAQLHNVITKYKKYEEGKFDQENWLNGAAFLATNDRYTIAEGSHNYAIDNYTTAQGYKGIFPNADEAGGDKLYAITYHVPDAKVKEALGLGRLIVNYSGHGASTFWDSPHFSQNDVRALNHSDATAFVISNACITGQFTVDESFGETWQRHPHGAVMYWGSMDNTYWDEDDILEKRMYDGIYRDNQTTFAEITDFAQKGLWLHYGGAGHAKYYWESYVVFGDPSQQLRTAYTKTPVLNGSEHLPVGIQSADYVITDTNGVAIKDAKVNLVSRDGFLRFSSRTDAQGVAAINFNGLVSQPTEFDVLVTGQNLVATASALTIMPSDQPFLGFANYSYNQRTLREAYLGETIGVNFDITNWGNQESEPTTVRIVLIEGPAEIVVGEALVPSLVAGASYSLRDTDLAIRVNNEAANREGIRIEIVTDLPEGQSARARLSLGIVKADLAIGSIDYGNDPQIQGITPGGSGDVYVTIQNTGSEAIVNGNIYLLPGNCVDTIIGEQAIPYLAPNETLRITQPFTATISSTCHDGDNGSVQAVLAYDSVAQRNYLGATHQIPVGLVRELSVNQENINLTLADYPNPAVSYDINWTKNGIITDVGIAIDITHTYIGDLLIKLVHPSGREVILHDEEDGDEDNLVRSYGRGGIDVPALKDLKGLRAEGNWKLVIQDKAYGDVGSLNHVTLTLAGYLAE